MPTGKYWPLGWQFARKLAKMCFSRAYQRIYVFAHKFSSTAKTHHTHTPYTHLDGACLWPARQLANNENVFHFNGQFPQISKRWLLLAVSAVAFFQKLYWNWLLKCVAVFLFVPSHFPSVLWPFCGLGCIRGIFLFAFFYNYWKWSVH